MADFNELHTDWSTSSVIKTAATGMRPPKLRSFAALIAYVHLKQVE
jgi:hypothetical protein